MSTILLTHSEVAALFLFVLHLVFFQQDLILRVSAACCPVHVILLLVEQEESLCGAAYSWMFPTLKPRPLHFSNCLH